MKIRKCCLCKKDKKNGRSLYYGFVCSDCMKALPNLFPLKKISEEQMLWLKNHQYDNFSDTANLGSLWLDEAHGLIQIHSGFMGKDKRRNVFSLLDMKEVSLSCVNARQNGNQMLCDAEIEFTLRCNLVVKKTVKQMMQCPLLDSKKDGYYELGEPKILCIFRSMMNQAIENQYTQGKAILDRLNEFESDRERVLAKGILMLPEIYTDEELKQHRNSLVKAFHPDNCSDEMASEFTDKINWAYRILKRD